MDTNNHKRKISLREICEEVNRKWEENKAQSALNSTQSMILISFKSKKSIS